MPTTTLGLGFLNQLFIIGDLLAIGDLAFNYAPTYS